MKKEILIVQMIVSLALACSCAPMQPNVNLGNSYFEENVTGSNAAVNNNPDNHADNTLQGTDNPSQLTGSTPTQSNLPEPASPDDTVLTDNRTLAIEIPLSQSSKGNLTFHIKSMTLYETEQIDDEMIKHTTADINEDASKLLLVEFAFINENIDISTLEENKFLVNSFSLQNCDDAMDVAELVYFDKTNAERSANEFFYYEIPSMGVTDTFVLGWKISDSDMDFLTNNKALLYSYYGSTEGNCNSFIIPFEDIVRF